MVGLNWSYFLDNIEFVVEGFDLGGVDWDFVCFPGNIDQFDLEVGWVHLDSMSKENKYIRNVGILIFIGWFTCCTTHDFFFQIVYLFYIRKE